MPQHSLAVFIDRTAVRHHAIGDFLGLGRQVPSRQQHSETQADNRADGMAPWPPPKLPQIKTQKCRAPALTRSARHHAQPLASKCDLIKAINTWLPSGIAVKSWD